jgi:arginine decarboxylase
MINKRMSMKISVRSGVGTGPTALAAFDEALRTAGVANFNLIRLSSIIPPGAEVTDKETEPVRGGWGDRLYAVYAEMRVEEPNEEAWAGVGWVQDENGQGLFVEHEGNSENQVRADIMDSLTSMMKARLGNYRPIEMRVVGKTCKDRPVCALVVAAYETHGWSK